MTPETFSSTTELTVRPPTSLLKSSGAGVVRGSQQAALDLAQNYLPASVKGKLWVSHSPMMQFADHLQYLVTYPHGCLEQTISTAFPQLYYADVLQALGENSTANAAQNVETAIRKLYTLQAYDGAMFYWPGGGYTSWWSTVYAAHFLQEAQKAGYEVEQRVLDKMYSYLRAQLSTKQTQAYAFVNAANQRIEKQVVPREVFYSLYVLANADRKEVSRMNYYRKRPDLMTIDSRYLLACTYLLVGDQANYRKLLPEGFDNERSTSELSGSFGSYIRDQALVLNALLESDPGNAQIGVLSKQLTEQLRASRYLNTQERAFAMLALGKLARKGAQSNAKATVVADGKQVGTFDGKPLVLTDEVAGRNVTIQATGDGELYYFWEVEGISATGTYTEEDNFLRVRREFFDRNGNPVSGNRFKQNDLVVVKITLSTVNGIPYVPNVVVTDMLPAGLEIENPRIGGIPSAGWIQNQAFPEHADFRDDRVHFFVAATAQAQSYYYLVRAVTLGTYRMGPVSADAMYYGDYHSYHGAGEVVVQ